MSRLSRRAFLQSAAAAAIATGASPQAVRAQGDQVYDYVIAGAGHNSLITAAYLVKAGFSVLVLEGRPTIGGGCKSGSVCLPGFKDDWCSSVHGLLMSNPIIRNNELNLFEHGLEYLQPDPMMHIPFPDNTSLTMWRDHEKTYEEYARFSRRDADTFLRLLDEVKAYRRDQAKGQTVSSLWRRRYAMSAYDLVKEMFEDDHIRSFHLAVGKFTSEPGGDPFTGRTAFTAIFHQLGGRPMPKGGSGMLTVALGRVIEGHGGVILTNMPVARLLIEAGKCTGVVCDDGTEFRARKGVVSTIHIKHLVNMAPHKLWGDEFMANLELFQQEEGLFAYHLATSAPVEYPLQGGGRVAPSESTILPYPERVLRSSYDDARGIVNLEDMWLQIISPSIVDPTRTPEGYHTVKILGNAPYNPASDIGSWNDIRTDVADGVLTYLQGFAPTFTRDKILAEVFMSPVDIERMNPAFWKGSIHAGEYGPAQMGELRPVPEWSDYRMPIPGLYQTGSCTRPGGSISGRPGRNAAEVVLADAGVKLEEVIAGT